MLNPHCYIATFNSTQLLYISVYANDWFTDLQIRKEETDLFTAIFLCSFPATRKRGGGGG